MKFAPLIALGFLWIPYSAFVTQLSGNPDWQPTVGQPGSTYDVAANPPKTDGVVAYNPYAPLPTPPAAPVPAPMPMPAR